MHQHAAKTTTRKPSKTAGKKPPEAAKDIRTAAERRADREAMAKTQPMLPVVFPSELPAAKGPKSRASLDE